MQVGHRTYKTLKFIRDNMYCTFLDIDEYRNDVDNMDSHLARILKNKLAKSERIGAVYRFSITPDGSKAILSYENENN